jgi:hypothetical protein
MIERIHAVSAIHEAHDFFSEFHWFYRILPS